jgi:hypothetical protein
VGVSPGVDTEAHPHSHFGGVDSQVFPSALSSQDSDGLRDDISRDAEILQFVGNGRDFITVLYRTRLL